jgi:large subunit ribosomal protein L23
MEMIINPRISEKAYAKVGEANIYCFNVPMSANKIEIKDAVEELYGVTVKAVNVVVTEGKNKRTVRKGGRQTSGKRSDYKKAYVSVDKGQTIPVFAANEEEK